ncbi:MAG: hypothetical protein C0403_19665 [Desulfobacterium sp.]|nr:hypothetical protein [Desulfobacterium sp.]
MKKIITALLIAIFCMATIAVAADNNPDVVLEAKIQSATIALDKNGHSYGRVIIEEKRTLSGIAYTDTAPVMFFGDLADKAKGLKKGDTLKCIAQRNIYQGRVTYNVKALM